MKYFYMTLIECLIFSGFIIAQTPEFSLKYDEADGTMTTYEDISSSNISITNQFGYAERVGGVGSSSNALRTDGFSTWIQTSKNFNFTTCMSIETWIVLESYPSDEELPYEYLTPSAIISQYDGNNGFSLFINTFGVWNLTTYINGNKYICQAPNPFPLYKWSHVVATIDGFAGTMKLYLNGAEVASISTPVNGTINKSGTQLMIGKSNLDKHVGIFLLNALNATYDNTKVYGSALTGSSISSHYSSEVGTINTTGERAIAVSPNRFKNDIQRPVYHGMPPSNWTNEPHGMINYNGKQHIFYQRTPNGPFKFQMHWGHMTSTDFVHWTNTKDALWPELKWSSTTGYDMKGIWSGDVWVEGGVAHAFYTCVNHAGPYNPGIAHATSSDTDFKTWTKVGPVIERQFVNDFRDPYIFKEGSTYYMIIGASVGSSGGLDCYTSTNLNNWSHKSDFCTVSYGAMDASLGSVIWEMPVFENLGNGKWILQLSPIGGDVGKYGPKYTRGVYWIGTFSGGRFKPDYITPKNLDVIHGHLSPTLARNNSGQIVAIGMVDERWNSESQLKSGWCHVYSLPRIWSLLPDNKTLGQAPAPELSSLRVPGSEKSFANQNVSGNYTLSGVSGSTLEIDATVANTTANKYGINFRVSPDRQEITRLYYDANAHTLVLDKSASTLNRADEERVLISQPFDESAFGKPTRFHVYLDNSIIDVFINEKAAFSARIYPSRTDSKGVELMSEGASTNFSSVNVWTTSLSSSSSAPVSVSGVSLDKNTTRIVEGNTEQLTASILPANATNQNIIWSSNDDAIASVSPNGLISAVSVGTATITVTTVDGGFVANCTVEILDEASMLVYDFERPNNNLNGWTRVSGTAFSEADVTNATDWGWGGPFNQQGEYHLWGALGDAEDLPVGEIKTDNFILGGDGIISFLIGGGFDISKVYIALVRASDNVELLKETGDNNDSEAYVQKQFDASDYVDTECYIKLVDNTTEGWGHINIDNIRIPLQVIIGLSETPSSNNNDILIYPNPLMGDDLTIEINSAVLSNRTILTVYDMVGSLLYQENLTKINNHISLNSLEAGVYLINVSNKGKKHRKRLVKE